MSGASGNALGAILLLLVVIATDLWVYADAKALSERGTPVVLSTDFLHVDTPVVWFFACLLVWIAFFPLYVTRRNQGG
jgi:hypothetical protein